jgi:L-ectoine synthase
MRVMRHGDTHRVDCPEGGFTSLRFLLERDGMGYTITHTTIHPSAGKQTWHYKNHLESCYCIAGYARLKDCAMGETYQITPGTLYVLDKHDRHEFTAITKTELLCVFNPPLKGDEVHGDDASYPRT